MRYVPISRDEYALIDRALSLLALVHPPIAEATAELTARLDKGTQPPTEREQGIIALAREGKQIDGEVEIDDNALLSEGGDNGAYVAAWVWCDFSGTPFDKEEESEEENEDEQSV